MEKVRTIVIDDEIGARETLVELIRGLNPKFDILAECDSADSGIQAIELHQPDLVFLDVNMPVKSGFDLLRTLSQPAKFKVIFITAHDQFAIDAIKVAAFDYLLKPLKPAELKASLEKFLSLYAAKGTFDKTNKIDVLLKNLSISRSENQKLAIPDLKGFTLIEISEVVYLEGDGNYTHFHLVDKSKISATRLLKEYEELLVSRNFCRIHQSHIVNLKYVKRFFKGNVPQVEMETGAVLNISRARKDDFLRHFNEFSQ